MTKEFTHLMIHCSATPKGKWFDADDITRWHIEERGWSRVGYSTLFLLDGTTDIMIPFDKDDTINSWEISNGARGWNGITRHICYIGGLNEKGNSVEDTRTEAQLAAMQAFVKMHIMLWPKVKIIGHNQVNAHKNCPSFNVNEWGLSIGLEKKHLDQQIYF
ncbi:N-acetylmuramoyl-L-alanine amidase [Fulvivirga maritima]|uniref:N-acetylmuramoyl-L-alanine amidase n=1 Tax=Fulvivirga maritima TaxID=2904247 RepID=UPI001F2EB816|nr:N-acetylmuramoyl-L-alanine amidase [Fulvivirga maritima]UII27021.1 N-acetylmuramoyl-L-alanine amidase [Fulvivirga maritima]